MLNQVILVGKIVKKPELVYKENGRPYTKLILQIERPNRTGDKEENTTDIIDCELWEGIAENTVEYCNEGATVGVKASIRSQEDLEHLGTYKKELLVEKITFINTKKDESGS